MLDNCTLENLTRILKGIAAEFGTDCEVVLHRVSEQSVDSSVIAIENGHVTGRKIGDGPSPVVLEQLANGEKAEDHLNYFTKTQDGKILKSSTIYIKNEDGNVEAILSINYDISRLSLVTDAISSLISIPAEPEDDAPQIAQNVTELLDDLIERSVRLVGKPVSLMNKSDKVAAIRFLDKHGALLITKSGDKIAKYFGISKYTLYSYLDDREGGISND